VKIKTGALRTTAISILGSHTPSEKRHSWFVRGGDTNINDLRIPRLIGGRDIPVTCKIVTSYLYTPGMFIGPQLKLKMSHDCMFACVSCPCETNAALYISQQPYCTGRQRRNLDGGEDVLELESGRHTSRAERLLISCGQAAAATKIPIEKPSNT